MEFFKRITNLCSISIYSLTEHVTTQKKMCICKRREKLKVIDWLPFHHVFRHTRDSWHFWNSRGILLRFSKKACWWISYKTRIPSNNIKKQQLEIGESILISTWLLSLFKHKNSAYISFPRAQNTFNNWLHIFL